MKQVNIHEAKTNFSKLVHLAVNGEEVIIANGGKPIAKLSSYTTELPPRQGGQFKGMMRISENFDAALPKEWLDTFYTEGQE